MTAYHSTDPRFYHPAGAEYTVSVYEVDTVIPLTTYADKDRAAMNPWPVVLEDDGVGNGYATIYIDAEFATIDLRDIDDVSVDGYPLTWVKPAQQDEVDAIDARLVLNEATDVAQTEAIGIAQADIIALDGRLTLAEGTITTHAGQIAALVIADGVLDGRLDAAEATIISHTNSIGALVNADTALDGRLDAAEATIISHTNSISALGNADTALDGRLDALELVDHAAPTGSAGSETYSVREPATNTLVQGGVGTTASNGYLTVTFPTAFSSAPVVVATAKPGASHIQIINVDSVTATNFVAVGGEITDGSNVFEFASINFTWIAIGSKT